MKRILFVDDEPAELERLRGLFVDMESDWSMAFVSSGEAALKEMFREPHDVVVTDLAMPEMEGTELLGLVMQRYPKTVRIALWEDGDRDTALRLAGVAHQDLLKPCNAADLKEVIGRALGLRDLLTNEKLKRLVSQVLSLPSMPALYLELLEELRAEDPSMDRISTIITRDPGMCAKMLHMVNSAFFGLRREMTTANEAAMYLGLETIKGLVLCLQFFALFEHIRIKELSFDRLWAHSWAVGVLAKEIARKQDLDRQEIEQVFMAGLLHDAGKLVLATGVPSQYQAALQQQQQLRETPLWKVEQEHFGATHAEVGAYLLALWGLPDPIVEAVAFHHHPADLLASHFTAVTAVHAANTIEHVARSEVKGTSALDLDHLAQIDLADRVQVWREAATELFQAGDRPRN